MSKHAVYDRDNPMNKSQLNVCSTLRTLTLTQHNADIVLAFAHCGGRTIARGLSGFVASVPLALIESDLEPCVTLVKGWKAKLKDLSAIRHPQERVFVVYDSGKPSINLNLERIQCEHLQT